MSEDHHPLQAIFLTIEKFSHCVQTHLSQFLGVPQQHLSSPQNGNPLFSVASNSRINPIHNNDNPSFPHFNDTLIKRKSASPVTKEELGRATWTFLHTLAAQYPDSPTRQQKKDVKELMAILSRMYPCKDCADHFKEVLRANPVLAGSRSDFSQWLCHVHNVVNRSLGKLAFPCERVDARWGKLDCENRACDLLGSTANLGSDSH